MPETYLPFVIIDLRFDEITNADCIAGNMSRGIISQSSSQWRLSTLASLTYDPDRHVQPVEEGLRHLGRQIQYPIMRRALISAASDAVQSSKVEMRDIEKRKSFESKLRKTIFGTILFQTQVVERQIIVDGEAASQNKTITSFIFHPALWLLRLGFSYGLNVTTNDQTWQYTILPVHAVPDDSAIFHFCEDGNIDAVDSLIKRGQASVRDTNTKGWTPLHVSLTEASCTGVLSHLTIPDSD